MPTQTHSERRPAARRKPTKQYNQFDEVAEKERRIVAALEVTQDPKEREELQRTLRDIQLSRSQ